MFKELRKLIVEAFPYLLPPSKYRLSDAITEDDYGDNTYSFKETWRTWEEIYDWQVAQCSVIFTYAPSEVAEYLLPRYMMFVLDDIENRLDDNTFKDAGDGSGDSAVYYIKKLKRNSYCDSSFCDIQIRALDTFIKSIDNIY